MWYANEEEFKSASGYEMNGMWFPRVTKILEIKSKPGLETFWKEVGHYSSAEDIKNKSALHGSLVHETVQRLVVGENVTIPEEIRPAVEKFQLFNEERKIFFYPEYIERRVWSARHRYAGTVDALAEIDGKFGVLDIKTSTGFFPEYNLQTAAYVSALQEFEVKRLCTLPKDIQTRWILRIDQRRVCKVCKATFRNKGGHEKIRPANSKKKDMLCVDGNHEWGEMEGDVAIREFPYVYKDIKAFMAAKILWEWENDYWLKKIGYLV